MPLDISKSQYWITPSTVRRLVQYTNFPRIYPVWSTVNYFMGQLHQSFRHDFRYYFTSKTPFGRRTSERESEPCTCRMVRGYFQLASARHPTSRSLAVCQLWRQSTRPFLRSGSGTLHLRTCKLGPKWLARHPTNRCLTAYQIWAQWTQPFSRSGSAPCTCARAVPPQS